VTPEEIRKRVRLRDDLTYYAPACLKIRPKKGSLAPLTLNQAQLYVHERLEAQKAETGKVRAIVLKGRQQGISTYVEGRFYQQTSHRRGCLAFILTHSDDGTQTLFDMVERYHANCFPLVKPHSSTSNRKELVFDRLDSGYKVSTAGSKGAGRSTTITLFHGSEVAYWPNADKHLAGALQAVPNEPGTEVILESTSDGPKGVFYEMCKAAQAGEGEYQLIFVPWFWQDEYRLPAGPSFEPTAEELEYGRKHGLDTAQLAWRRAKIVELHGVSAFQREYPSDIKEAFTADAKGALWQRETIERNRVAKLPEGVELVRIVVAIDPQATEGAKDAETGICVAGLGTDRRGYLLDDLSRDASPDGWGSAAVAGYDKWKADRVIAEKNNGGDMVRAVLQTVRPGLPIELVWASRGKQTRAEPIAALDEQGRISHVGHHPTLENEMCTWVPGVGASPNRVDARVWAFTELMVENTGAGEIRVLG
jgi:hypothetical protein